MILHLAPKIYYPYSDISCSLIDIAIPELSVILKGDIDLAVRKPYPNKHYYVACRKVGRKALNGLLLQTTSNLKEFTVISTWRLGIGANVKQAKHIVHYHLLDSDFEMITDTHTVFGKFESNGIQYPNRHVDEYSDAPVKTMPRMDVLSQNTTHFRGDNCAIKDTYDDSGMLVERIEHQFIPTIEKDRLFNWPFDERLPSLENLILID